jgi:hypothetical protein
MADTDTQAAGLVWKDIQWSIYTELDRQSKQRSIRKDPKIENKDTKCF